MRSIKNHLGLILPLVALLFAVQFSILSNSIIKEYESLMSKDYNIIVVSAKELKEQEIKSAVPNVANISPVNTKKIIDRLDGEISAKNLSILQNALPKFYSIKLKDFIDTKRINSIKSALLKVSGITQVETFSKTHDKIYKALQLAKYLSYIFMIIIATIGTILILKQIRIWLYEHRDRIEIMTLFGAPFWLKSSILYRTAFIDSIVATIIVVVFFALTPDIKIIKNILSQIDLSMPRIVLQQDTPILFVIALTISMIAVSIVMSTQKRNHE